MTQIGEGVFKFTADDSEIDRSLGRISRNVKREGEQIERGLEKSFRSGGRAGGGAFVRSIKESGLKAKAVFANLGQGIGLSIGNALANGAANAIGAIKNQLGDVLRVGIDAEQTAVAFETLIGDAKEAKRVLKDLSDFAASTPFELPEVQAAGRSLLAFGISTEKLKNSLKSIGDVASGVGAPIGEIAEIYGKARVQGQLFAEDINQLTGRGIPIIQELAKQFGVTDDAVKELVKSGKVNFSNLEKAFADLSGEGGKFFDLMDKQSATTGGKISNLSDSFTRMKVQIFEAFSPQINAAIDAAGSAMQMLSEWVTQAAQAWNSLTPEAQKAIGITAAIATGLTALGVVAGTVSAIISTGLVASIGAAVAAAAPFIAAGAAIAAGIAAVSVAISKAVSWWDSLSDAQKEAVRENQPIQAAIGNTIDSIRALIDWLGKVTPVLLEWAAKGVSAAITLAQGFATNLAIVIEWINRAIVFFRDYEQIVGQVRDSVVNALLDITSGARNWASGVIGAIDEQLAKVPILQRAFQTFGDIFQGIFQANLKIVKALASGFVTLSGGAVTNLKAIVNAIKPLRKELSEISDLTKKAADGFKNFSKFLPGLTLGVGGGNPLEALKSVLSGGVPATRPGQASVVNPFGGRVTSLATTTPHHSYQRTSIGLARDVTLLNGQGGTRVGVPSAISGVVEAAGRMGGYGNAVIVRALNGMKVLMGHFESLAVRTGQAVQFGQNLGVQGSTGRSSGPHVHIEAASAIIDRWLKFISGTGEFAITQRGRGGGDPTRFRINEHDDHGDHAMFGQGGADIEELEHKHEQKLAEYQHKLDDFKATIDRITDQIRTAEAAAQNDYLLGITTEQEATEAAIMKRLELGQAIQETIPHLQEFIQTASEPSAIIAAEALLQEIRAISAETANQITLNEEAIAKAKEAKAEAETTQTVADGLNDSILQVGRSAKNSIVDALFDKGQGLKGLLDEITKSLAKLAINAIFSSVFGGSGGFLGGIFGANSGGTVPNFATGGSVGLLNQIGSALAREGPNAVLAALTPGEEVLSLRNNDAQAFRAMRRSGLWQQMKMIEGYRGGGTVSAATTTKASGRVPQAQGITIDRINQVDYVSLEQLQGILDVRDPMVARAGASLVESRLESTNYRRQYGF